MSLDIEFALRDAKLDKYVTVEDAVVDGVEYVVIRPNGYLGKETFGKIARELEQFKVEYLSLGKNSHWRTKKETIMQMQPQKEPKAVSIETMMPKGIDSQPAYKDAGNAFPTKPLDGDGRSKQTTQPQVERDQSESEYDLKLSRDKLGALIPILEDANGNIIDGFHRKEIDPSWPRIMLPKVTDPVQLSMARLAANVCRREVSPEEKTKLLANIAELTGWDANEIAQSLGMSYQWVMKYLPSQFKEKTWQRETAIPQRRIEHENVKTQHSIESPDLRLPFEKQDITPKVPVKKIDTGFLFECPRCNRKYHLIHIDPSGKHIFEEDKVA